MRGCLLFWLGFGVAIVQRRAVAYFDDLLPTQADIDAQIAYAERALRGDER